MNTEPKKFPLKRTLGWCFLLVACAGGAVHGMATPKASQTPTGESEEAIQEREAAAREEKTYRESMEKITDKVLREEVALADCADAGKDCKELREKFCEIDTLIDSRGEHYVKRFCNLEPQR